MILSMNYYQLSPSCFTLLPTAPVQGFNPTAFVTNSMTTTTASPVHVRQSRVMRTNDEDKSKAFRQVITKREYERLKAQKLSADLGVIICMIVYV